MPAIDTKNYIMEYDRPCSIIHKTIDDTGEAVFLSLDNCRILMTRIITQHFAWAVIILLVVHSVSDSIVDLDGTRIEAETKWPPFRRQHL